MISGMFDPAGRGPQNSHSSFVKDKIPAQAQPCAQTGSSAHMFKNRGLRYFTGPPDLARSHINGYIYSDGQTGRGGNLVALQTLT